MDLTPALDRIRAVGVHLDVRAGELMCEASPGVMTPRREVWLDRHEFELVQLVQPGPWADDPAAWINTPELELSLACREPAPRVIPLHDVVIFLQRRRKIEHGALSGSRSSATCAGGRCASICPCDVAATATIRPGGSSPSRSCQCRARTELFDPRSLRLSVALPNSHASSVP